MNPAVGCYYILPGYLSSFVALLLADTNSYCLVNRGTCMYVNDIMTVEWPRLNQQPLASALSIVPRSRCHHHCWWLLKHFCWPDAIVVTSEGRHPFFIHWRTVDRKEISLFCWLPGDSSQTERLVLLEAEWDTEVNLGHVRWCRTKRDDLTKKGVGVDSRNSKR